MDLNNYLLERKSALANSDRPAMIMTHVVCGYPSFEDNWKALEVMQSFGVDLVELQFPFSEPSADGPLFVKANQEAILNGVHVDDCFEFMQKVTAHFSFKVVMMGYYNTVFKTGQQQFLERLKAAGAVGFILPDLPVDEAGELHSIAKQLGLAPILLMTPTNSDARLDELAQSADGFIYTVARKGVTGSNTDMNHSVSDFIDRCRQFTTLPLAVGFGVSTAADVEFIGAHADIAVIGTAALKAWEHGGEASLTAFFKQLLPAQVDV
ncbi:tryptophan synthase subunit alpha [Arenicella xantha]|uniref:Tryptophan synthase alpha chain n=1 Tax=Arenicella xantha TaxID=644221 RepID=A0A395JHG6_9GAMM|nr:tryptophan synthase subunit alpha [Arenicella xantha]RBP48895.1 tryptophan synthase alpha chain [Arenicella xantha]